MPNEVIAILRGVQPHEIIEIADALVEAGIRQIEVPLNSPDPFESIEKIAHRFDDHITIGAGTVLNVNDVEKLANAGGTLIVAPECNVGVIRAGKAAGMAVFPGVLTPTECFTALNAGADGLKIFPAGVLGIDGLSALRAVLPAQTKVYAVGGIGPSNFSDWLAAGATGFGMGSAIYKPGDTAAQVTKKASEIVAAFEEANRRVGT